MVCAISLTSAQNNDNLSRFMEKYSSTWAGNDKQSVACKQIGQPMPAFYFSKTLNSKALKGKYVVLNFWATWCGGCRLLSVDLDSLMIKHSDEYKDVQLIGVDCLENLVDKGYVAAKFWKDKNIGYPSVYGKSADACCKSVDAGHPCAMLIDPDGIVRGRWDAWTPSTAEDIRLATWVLKVMPQKGIKANAETVTKLLNENRYREALYLLEIMPDDISTAALRFKVMMNCEENAAVDYYNTLFQKYEGKKPKDAIWSWKPDSAYINTIKEITAYIYQSKTQSSSLLKIGCDTSRAIMNYGGGSDYNNYLKNGVLKWRYGRAVLESGMQMMESAVEIAKHKNASQSEIDRLQKAIDTYKVKSDESENDVANQRMYNEAQDEAAHKALIQKKNH